jgi:hypothetical protein
MLGKFIAGDFIAIAGEMHSFPASNENTVHIYTITIYTKKITCSYFLFAKCLSVV